MCPQIYVSAFVDCWKEGAEQDRTEMDGELPFTKVKVAGALKIRCPVAILRLPN